MVEFEEPGDAQFQFRTLLKCVYEHELSHFAELHLLIIITIYHAFIIHLTSQCACCVPVCPCVCYTTVLLIIWLFNCVRQCVCVYIHCLGFACCLTINLCVRFVPQKKSKRNHGRIGLCELDTGAKVNLIYIATATSYIATIRAECHTYPCTYTITIISHRRLCHCSFRRCRTFIVARQKCWESTCVGNLATNNYFLYKAVLALFSSS